MKERPILFNSEMVRAILDDRKTMTRRVIKPQPHICYNGDLIYKDHLIGSEIKEYNSIPYPEIEGVSLYGIPGDQLWAREAWCKFDNRILYKANYKGQKSKPFKWKPSIHMFRRHSRIQLEITSIRVERVQNITEEDALKEGSFLNRCPCTEMNKPPKNNIEAVFQQTGCHIHGTEFKHLWNSINKKRGFGWDANPWVWVVEFKRITECQDLN